MECYLQDCTPEEVAREQAIVKASRATTHPDPELTKITEAYLEADARPFPTPDPLLPPQGAVVSLSNMAPKPEDQGEHSGTILWLVLIPITWGAIGLIWWLVIR